MRWAFDDDPALRRLAEHLGQPHHRHGARADDVGQHLPRPDARQLIHIADDQQRRLVRQRLQQRAHQRHVHHAGLVHHQQVAVERVHLAALEAAGLGIGLQQAVDGPAFQPGALGQALGGPSGRRAEGDLRRPWPRGPSGSS